MPAVLAIRAFGVHAHGGAARHVARRVQGQRLFLRRIARYHRLHRHRFYHQRLALHEECKPLAVGPLEACLYGGQVAKGHHQRRVAALVAHVHAPQHLHGAGAHLLAGEFLRGRLGQRIQLGGNAGQGIGLQRRFHRLLADHALVGQAHAVGAQHTSQRVHKHLFHAQRVGHQTGVLAARAAKALQRVAGHVVTTRHRDFLDGIGHLLHGNADEALRGGLRAQPGFGAQRGKALAHHLGIERLVGVRAKAAREVFGLHLAHHHVGIGHGQRATAPVAGRAGVGARTLRAHAQAGTVELQHRTAARRHSVDAHHGCTHAHAGHLRLELALERPGVVAHVGGGAAHVEADDAAMARQLRGAGHAHNAAGRARQNRVLALENLRIGQATGRLHEEQAHARHFAGHLVHIAPQNGRQVGVHHGGVAPADELHHGAGFVRGAYLREAYFAGQPCGGSFVFGIAVAVHEHHRHAAQALVELGLQARAQRRLVQRLQHGALRIKAFLGLQHGGVQKFGQHNVAVEQARAVLVGNAQRVAKTPRGDQQCGLALPFQQCVGGHGGAHLHALHLVWRDGLAGLQAQQMAYASHCGVPVLLGVLAQQLVRHQRAIGALAHDVGEGAAAVYPELPALGMGR